MSNYPDKIFTRPSNEEMLWHSDQLKAWEVADMVRNAYDICKREHATQEATTEPDWHNLTEQIQAGANIDWEQLDGVPAKCVHESGAVYQHRLVRDKENPLGPVSLLEYYYPTGWGGAFAESWDGDDGWTLYIDRPVPLKRKTADQLELGVEFIGHPRSLTEEPGYCYTVTSGGKRKIITAKGVLFDPEWVEVVDDA